ncbi:MULTISPECIES: TOTE conflict system archaeo-eukaryotic primase domain-containing protein [Vibrio]|uniref:TOTE conflict system archaeo-eukaryotic primase domain-containing protein n=1 Tax=Vibrio TaxID=662 RepID=UPI0011DB021F|nr:MULTISPECIES: DEAD/DEAH box helicase [Vibrio]EGZ6803615.1 DEAD/DEAH box helicase [Vibrio cholerae]EKO3966233.1 DEAD/DEAH box helicase [Vibrio fluvialis]MBL4289087.1 DEAD/DEAH box helicase family protein [Vibrio fluvialis]TXY53576.1 DEAD/DEAH box helicase [Vibrio cholerae]GIB30340.1 DNA helicase [Vibrio cholerae]
MDELELIEQKIHELKKELAQLEQQKQRLLTQEAITKAPACEMSPQQKLSIYQSYFKGNTQCYARRWQNQQGRSGYAIACENEWHQGLCGKPKIKCLECPNQAFKPLDDAAMYAHLTGKEVVGLYPMLADNTCWLLAVDFDKSDWQEASLAYVEVCKLNGIDCLLERSRSGQGAHVWIFFAQATDAKVARQLGFYLLDEAMKIHGALSFDSYDRLFPNQDVLPIGGIGNLIALPLQKQARANGNSVFVDQSFTPYFDQWEMLASMGRLSIEKIELLLESKVEHRNDTEDGVSIKPWERTVNTSVSIPDKPKALDIVLANRLYLPISQVPNPLIAQFKKLASFSNPKFFKAQGLRLSTNGIARFICLAELDSGYLCLPRGCWDDVKAICSEFGIALQVTDNRFVGQALAGMTFVGSLRSAQSKAIDVLMQHDIGVLHAPTAFGKTVTAIGLIQRRGVNTLILVHNKQLVDQWQERLKAFTQGIGIGVYTGTKKKPTGQVDIATYQSLINRSDNSVHSLMKEYGQIIVDECHHLSAPQYEQVLSEAHAKYVVGVSATLERRDGHQPIIFMQAGRVRHTIKSDRNNQFAQVLDRRELTLEVPLHLSSNEPKPHISEIYRWLMLHPIRNATIVEGIQNEVAKGRVPIVLTERREHANIIAGLLNDAGITHQILVGSMKKKQQAEVMSKLDSTQVVVATGRFVGEGFDLPRLDTLILALPVSWKGSLIQYVGRIQRDYKGKEEVKVIDYVDAKIPMLLRMFNKREKGYRALGFLSESIIQEQLI